VADADRGAVPPASAVADVLALRGGDGWLTPPLHAVVAPPVPVIGRVRTVQLVASERGDGLVPLYELLSERLDGRVLVIAGATTVPGAVWGEILARSAADAGATAVLVHGAVRDRPETTSIGLPLFGWGESVVGPNGRAHVVAVDATVEVDGVELAEGDVVVADATGCVRILGLDAPEVLDAASRYAAAEAEVLAALAAGQPLRSAYRAKKAVVDELRQA